MDTLIYCENINAFESMIDSNASDYIYIDDELYIIDKQGDILKFNGGKTTSGYVKESYISFIVNKNFSDTKIFDNIEYYFSNKNNTAEFDSIVFGNSNQNAVLNNAFSIKEGTHKVSIPRASADKFAERLRDKYLKCKCTIDMTNSGNQDYALPYIKTKFRYSFI